MSQVAVEVEGIEEGEPAVGVLGAHPGLRGPIAAVLGCFNLLLSEINRPEVRAGQAIQAEAEPGVLLDFFTADNQAWAGTAGQEWDARVDAQYLEDLLRVLEVTGRDKDQPE